MIGFIGTSLQLQLIMTAHNQWLTMNIFSSTVTNDERKITADTLNSLEQCLSDESPLLMNYGSYNFQAAWIYVTISDSSYVILCYPLPWESVFRNLLPSKWTSTSSFWAVFTKVLPSKLSYSITILLGSMVFWVVTLCCLERAQHSRETLHFQAVCSSKHLADSELHCVTTQMTGLFIITAVRSSYPVQYVIIWNCTSIHTYACSHTTCIY
jgi:hypothetical protein